MKIDVVTAFPGLVEGPLQYSIVHQALKKGLVQIRAFDLRLYTANKHRQIDDYPFGGGGGMVLKPEPLFNCIESLQAEASTDGEQYEEIIYLTPDGELLNQSICNELSLKKRLMMIAGHYKGIDNRVREKFVTREISIGDYVISGGEQAATVLIDAIVRLIPGVLSDVTSALSDSFQDGLLDAPVYTRPTEFRGMKVPEVLVKGDHAKIDVWRDEQRLIRTRARRPDLLGDNL
jgi:tRNA (guanine37-N1)-methyltransferase